MFIPVSQSEVFQVLDTPLPSIGERMLSSAETDLIYLKSSRVFKSPFLVSLDWVSVNHFRNRLVHRFLMAGRGFAMPGLANPGGRPATPARPSTGNAAPAPTGGAGRAVLPTPGAGPMPGFGMFQAKPGSLSF